MFRLQYDTSHRFGSNLGMSYYVEHNLNVFGAAHYLPHVDNILY